MFDGSDKAFKAHIDEMFKMQQRKLMSDKEYSRWFEKQFAIKVKRPKLSVTEHIFLSVPVVAIAVIGGLMLLSR